MRQQLEARVLRNGRPVARCVKLRIQQSTRGEIAGDLFFRLTQQSNHGGQRHLLGLQRQIIIGPLGHQGQRPAQANGPAADR